MLRIAIIGSGASALASVEAALSLDKSIAITLIDPWRKLPTEVIPKTEINPAQLAKKSRFGSLAMYDYPLDLVQINTNLHVPLSSTVGGLTSVWGANSIVPSTDFLSKYIYGSVSDSINWVKDYCNLTKLSELSDSEDFFISGRFKRIISKYKPDNDLELSSATLALEASRCSRNGRCLSGCGENAIYSAEARIIELVENRNISLRAGFAEKILVSSDSKFSIILLGENDMSNSVETYDKVFVACGAIGTCSLLQRSGLMPDEVQLRDTQVFYVPFFIRYRERPRKSSFELTQLFLRRHQSLHISIYEFSEHYLARARILIGPLVRLVPLKIWKHIVAGIGFIDSEHSGLLNLKYFAGKTEVTQMQNKKTKKMVASQLKSITKIVAKLGLFRIPFLTQIGNVGASYHIGAVASAGQALIGTGGKLLKNESIELYVVDSAGLYNLPIGPITTTVMALSYGRTKLVLST